MHDIVAHSLAVIVTQAQGGELAAAKSPERAVATLGTIAATGRLALADMRRLLGVLRADDAGTTGSQPQPTLADLAQLLEGFRAAGLTVRRTDDGTPRPVGSATELTVYRVVQESLTNTLRHAGPGTHADLRLAWGEHELTVTVGDNGRGVTGSGTTVGHGLIGMRERVAVLDGTLTAGPGPGGGFEVRAVIPTAEVAVADAADRERR
jgi:signal transduction histidine kinase